jgi:hypothetical protein
MMMFGINTPLVIWNPTLSRVVARTTIQLSFCFTEAVGILRSGFMTTNKVTSVTSLEWSLYSLPHQCNRSLNSITTIIPNLSILLNQNNRVVFGTKASKMAAVSMMTVPTISILLMKVLIESQLWFNMKWDKTKSEEMLPKYSSEDSVKELSSPLTCSSQS